MTCAIMNDERRRKSERLSRKLQFLVRFEWPAKWLPRWVKEEMSLSAKTIIDLKKQLDRANQSFDGAEIIIESMQRELSELRKSNVTGELPPK